MPKPRIEVQREVIMTKQAIDAVAAWRALEPSEKLRIRQSVVIDRVVASMAMEGEPVSQKWINQAKARRAQLVASTPPEVHYPTRSYPMRYLPTLLPSVRLYL
jgi:hypothetical protein